MDLWNSFYPILLLKQDYIEDVAQDHPQMAFEYFQGERLNQVFVQSVPITISVKLFPDDCIFKVYLNNATMCS